MTFLKSEPNDYELNFFRHTLYDKENRQYLLTTDDGSYLFINQENFKELRKGSISNEDTFNKLLEKGIIINDSNLNQVIEKTRERYSFLDNGTSLHIVIPTDRCNLGCSYCFADPAKITENKDEHDLDEKTALKIVDFIMNSPSHSITIEFQGGEATARFDTVKIMAEHALKLNEKMNKDLILTIVTNLTLMTDDMANYLIDKNISICTSLDGPKEVHDKNRFIHIREGKEIGTHDKVVYWIDRINDLYKEKNKKETVNALMTISKHSLPYHKEIIDEYLKYGLNIMDIRSLTIVGKAATDPTNVGYTFPEFIKFYRNSLKYLDELKKNGIITIDRMRELYKVKVLENKPTFHTDFESPCGAATGQIVYHSNGDIYTCHEALGRDEFKIGNVFKNNWNDIFDKKETAKAILNSMLESNIKCDRCVYKPYCGTCMVENYYHFGKFNYYPTKTPKHHETIMHCTELFDDILKKQNIN